MVVLTRAAWRRGASVGMVGARRRARLAEGRTPGKPKPRYYARMLAASFMSRLRSRAFPAAALYALACHVGAVAAAAAPQQDVPANPLKSAVVTAITTAISIDGVLDEEAWLSAPSIGELTQRQPNPGRPPTEATKVTLLHDADNLYI